MGTKGKGFAVSNSCNHRENSTILCTALQTVLPFPGFWGGSLPGGLGNQRMGTGCVASLSAAQPFLSPGFHPGSSPGGLGNQCIGTGSVASLSASQPLPLLLVSSMYQVGRVRELTHSYKLRSGIKKSLADWRDFSICVGITYLPGKSPCKYCRRR